MLDTYFKISERGSTVGREVRGGLVTFFTMAYIVALNPLIIGLTKDVEGKYIGGGDAPNLALVAAMTALMAGVLTILMGVVGNYPLALATGLGLNTFVAVGIASQMTWADAMGLVVLEGIIITVLVLTGFRTAVFKAVPAQLKVAISVGIGLFIALIGLVDAGFVRKTGSGPVPVTLGDGGTLVGWPIIVFALGLFLTIGLMVKKVKGAILIGIVVATTAAVIIETAFKVGPGFDGTKTNPKGWGLNVPAVPEAIVATPDFGLFGQFNLFGSLDRIPLITVILLVFTLLLSDFFDTVGTVTAIGSEAAGTANVNGLTYGGATSGVLAKGSGVWSGPNLATGTASYFRLYGSVADTLAVSTTLIRVQGTCGTSGSDYIMSSTSLTKDYTHTVDGFTLTLPAS
jgi:AGZA family xanthine/uracil permease-like MFS transporter